MEMIVFAKPEPKPKVKTMRPKKAARTPGGERRG
jgi:hypothetical protein